MGAESMWEPLCAYLHCEGEDVSALFAAERGVNEHWLPSLTWGLRSCMEAARGCGMDPDCFVKRAWQDAHRGGHLLASAFPWLLVHLPTRPGASS